MCIKNHHKIDKITAKYIQTLACSATLFYSAVVFCSVILYFGTVKTKTVHVLVCYSVLSISCADGNYLKMGPKKKTCYPVQRCGLLMQI